MKTTLLVVISLLMLFLTLPPSIAEEATTSEGAVSQDVGILPDSPWYGSKRFFETVGTFFTVGEEQKTERALQLADRRLLEAQVMAREGKTAYIAPLTQEYQDKVTIASSYVTKSTEYKERLAETVSEATSRQIKVLDSFETIIPVEATATAKEARSTTIAANKGALQELSQYNPVRAAEIAMGVAETRAQAVKEYAEQGSSERVITAAAEYEEYATFGQEISTIARQIGTGETAVGEVVATATAVHVEVLQNVATIVPDQAREKIEEVIAKGQAVGEAVEGRGEAIPPPPLPTVTSGQRPPQSIRPNEQMVEQPRVETGTSSDTIVESNVGRG
ncbi:hypothetical protein HYW21_01870 [Candidatus Woesearchaeota archaeon]|nr:hypothetical protein [Candidatus Woesearchaeota archaeon]